MPLCFGSGPVRRKIVVLGDGACGKTSLLNIFTRGYFPTVYEPTVFENYVHDVYIDSVRVELDLWDTAGQEEYDRLRSMAYEGTHTVMLCFAVDSPESFDNVESKWMQEIRSNCPLAKVVLVALKCDLRGDEEHKEENVLMDEKAQGDIIRYPQGLKKAREIQASVYLECSAKSNRGVREAFTEAARTALQIKEKQTCIVQ